MSIRSIVYSIVVVCLCVLPMNSANAVLTVIDVDFEETTPGADGTATAANLNQEVTGGTWVANAIEESQVRTDNGNNVLNVDRGSYDYDLGSFLAAPMGGVELSYDTYIQRTAGSANAKKNFFFGTDSDGDEVFRLVLTTDGSANPTNGRLKYVDAGGTEIIILDGLNSEGGNGIHEERLQNVRLVFNPTGYDIYIEDVLWVTDAEYRTAFGSLDGLAMLTLDGTGSADGNASGAFYDNILVTAIPEPATISLGIFGVAGLLMRRRRSA